MTEHAGAWRSNGCVFDFLTMTTVTGGQGFGRLLYDGLGGTIDTNGESNGVAVYAGEVYGLEALCMNAVLKGERLA